MSELAIICLAFLGLVALANLSAIVWLWVEVKRAIAGLYASVGGGIKVVVQESKESYTVPIEAKEVRAIYRDEVEDKAAKKNS